MDNRLLGLSAARVLVVGDVILDRYWYGETRRISPEAPVPIVTVDRTEERAGGAANVAANVVALGANAQLIGVVGTDIDGDHLGAICVNLGIRALFARVSRPTIVKLRVVSQHQQIVRLDFEAAPESDCSAVSVPAMAQQLPQSDVVILSDYGKGALHNVSGLIAAARASKRPVIVDPKGADFTRYRGATLITPNLHEFEAVVGSCGSEEVLVQKARRLIAELDLQGLLITRGDAGMSLVERDADPLHLRARSRDVFDVTGAGDTVCAVTATALAAGVPLTGAVMLANTAAGIVVGKFGAATVTREEIDAELLSEVGIARGILSTDQLLEERATARRRGETVIMTNGCFDVLHEGHVRFLKQAKALGHRLVVAVNDDASVKNLKGSDRPINRLQSRMCVLAALDAVDWVVSFSDATPQALIARVLPDILVKGGDYTEDDIAGGIEVRAGGGRVMALEYHAGHSTTRLVDQIKEITRSQS
jgi:D-beta-D-heptose 7-phosphate kinase / D-beta-D-heptose 1-phosphate adenosyltransferase